MLLVVGTRIRFPERSWTLPPQPVYLHVLAGFWVCTNRKHSNKCLHSCNCKSFGCAGGAIAVLKDGCGVSSLFVSDVRVCGGVVCFFFFCTNRCLWFACCPHIQPFFLLLSHLSLPLFHWFTVIKFHRPFFIILKTGVCPRAWTRCQQAWLNLLLEGLCWSGKSTGTDSNWSRGQFCLSAHTQTYT